MNLPITELTDDNRYWTLKNEDIVNLPIPELTDDNCLVIVGTGH